MSDKSNRYHQAQHLSNTNNNRVQYCPNLDTIYTEIQTADQTPKITPTKTDYCPLVPVKIIQKFFLTAKTHPRLFLIKKFKSKRDPLQVLTKVHSAKRASSNRSRSPIQSRCAGFYPISDHKGWLAFRWPPRQCFLNDANLIPLTLPLSPFFTERTIISIQYSKLSLSKEATMTFSLDKRRKKNPSDIEMHQICHQKKTEN